MAQRIMSDMSLDTLMSPLNAELLDTEKTDSEIPEKM